MNTTLDLENELILVSKKHFTVEKTHQEQVSALLCAHYQNLSKRLPRI